MISPQRTDLPVNDITESGSESGNGSALIQMTQDQLTQLIQAAIQSHQGGTGIVPHEKNQFVKRNKDFVSLGGTTFSDGAIEAIKWLMQCDSVFEAMELTPVEARELAAHQLTGEALYWWDYQRKVMDQKVFDEMTWVDFKGLFKERFLPEAIRSLLAEEFSQLVQGGRSVSEYMARFDELSMCAPHWIKGTMKNEKFIRGLRPEIQRVVLSVVNQPFSVIYDLALRMEQLDKEDKVAKHMNSGHARGHDEDNQGGWFHPYVGDNRGGWFHPYVGDNRGDWFHPYVGDIRGDWFQPYDPIHNVNDGFHPGLYGQQMQPKKSKKRANRVVQTWLRSDRQPPIGGRAGANRGGWLQPCDFAKNFNGGFLQGPYRQRLPRLSKKKKKQAKILMSLGEKKKEKKKKQPKVPMSLGVKQPPNRASSNDSAFAVATKVKARHAKEESEKANMKHVEQLRMHTNPSPIQAMQAPTQNPSALAPTQNKSQIARSRETNGGFRETNGGFHQGPYGKMQMLTNPSPIQAIQAPTLMSASVARSQESNGGFHQGSCGKMQINQSPIQPMQAPTQNSAHVPGRPESNGFPQGPYGIMQMPTNPSPIMAMQASTQNPASVAGRQDSYGGFHQGLYGHMQMYTNPSVIQATPAPTQNPALVVGRQELNGAFHQGPYGHMPTHPSPIQALQPPIQNPASIVGRQESNGAFHQGPYGHMPTQHPSPIQALQTPTQKPAPGGGRQESNGVFNQGPYAQMPSDPSPFQALQILTQNPAPVPELPESNSGFHRGPYGQMEMPTNSSPIEAMQAATQNPTPVADGQETKAKRCYRCRDPNNFHLARDCTWKRPHSRGHQASNQPSPLCPQFYKEVMYRL